MRFQRFVFSNKLQRSVALSSGVDLRLDTTNKHKLKTLSERFRINPDVAISQNDCYHFGLIYTNYE